MKNKPVELLQDKATKYYFLEFVIRKKSTTALIINEMGEVTECGIGSFRFLSDKELNSLVIDVAQLTLRVALAGFEDKEWITGLAKINHFKEQTHTLREYHNGHSGKHRDILTLKYNDKGTYNFFVQTYGNKFNLSKAFDVLKGSLND